METNEQALDRAQGLPGEVRRRSDALHDADRDGRSRRRARVPGLRQDQRLRRLVRHARRAGLHAPAWRSRAHRDPRWRRADQHAAAALLPARHAARVRAARQGLRGRRRLQQGLSEPRRAHEGADRAAREESADGEGDASADRRDGRHQDRRAPARERDRDGALLADHDDPRAGHRRRRGEERLPEHAGARGHGRRRRTRT